MEKLDEIKSKDVKIVAPKLLVPKKRPGRPRKEVPVNPEERFGIINKPKLESDFVELIYTKPALIAKIFLLFHGFKTASFTMQFTPTQLIITGVDHLKKSFITATIDCKYMNLYYCKETISITINEKDFNDIMNTISTTHCKITFIIKEEQLNKLYITLKNNECSNEDYYSLNVNHIAEDNTEAKYDDSEYPIKFKLPCSQFKTKIANGIKFGNVLNIEKCGDEPLRFIFDGKNKNVNWSSVYNNPSSIGLKSMITPDDIFNIGVNISYFSPIATKVDSFVYIAAHPTKRISFTTHHNKCDDGGYCCSLKVFTEIISDGKLNLE